MRKLTQRKILDKVFNTKFRGYNPEEVDQFLDLVIKDYQSFEDEIESLQSENEILKSRVQRASETKKATEKNTTTVTNFDILKRLSNLEREVFGSKLKEAESEE